MVKVPIAILAVDDEEAGLEALRQILTLEGYSVQTSTDGVRAIDILQRVPFDIILLDIMMPNIDGLELLKFIKAQGLDSEVIMLTAVHDVRTVVECMKMGAFYYIAKPYEMNELLMLVDRAVERRRMRIRNLALRKELERRESTSDIITQDQTFLGILDIASRAAPTDSPILVQGGSGTGKELVAEYIHKNSLRKKETFLAVNCASIPETLMESELFGHEKGAFTDAGAINVGVVGMSNGGTLFLDEVGDMPLSVQPKILRFLQTGEFRRVGATMNMRADVRIISATNKNLSTEVAAQRFRQDLYLRLNVITLDLPPLRRRKNDIPLLVNHFLKKKAGAKKAKSLDPEALQVLLKYDWPGNVHELENVIERAVTLSEDDIIGLDDLAMPLHSHNGGSSVRSSEKLYAGSAVTLAEMQKAHIQGVLKSVSWDKNLASKILGVSSKTLYEKMQRMHIPNTPPR